MYTRGTNDHTSNHNRQHPHTGLLTCSRYAYPPNALHFCGPELQDDLVGYQQQHYPDSCALEIIRQFQTLYPYLRLIAGENNIRDPFDERVVEAYWIGNALLNNISMNNLYRHFTETLTIQRNIPRKDFAVLTGKFEKGAFPHHTFHVLNIFTRTGHHASPHTLETMDACRIGWGKITHILRTLSVETQPLILNNGKLSLGTPVAKYIHLPEGFPVEQLKTGRFVSFHWGQACDILSTQQVASLAYYTNKALDLASTTR